MVAVAVAAVEAVVCTSLLYAVARMPVWHHVPQVKGVASEG